MNLIIENKTKINQLCIDHNVEQLYAFGSILTDKFNNKSDIDLLVQFASVDLKDYFDNYMDFKEKVESLFNRPVDIIENQAVKNPIFRKVLDREKRLIYG